jgi:hypothetical protein
MGSELSCPCEAIITDEREKKKNINEDLNKMMQLRLTKDEIIYQFCYENTKIIILKTINLENFFQTRSMLKLTNNKEVRYLF